ncbi:general secretion pathway protein C [Vibrio variabilis]|uniref:General secretion pathway protein C n=1 Tax=Vibrio variabilis TaxID=990271 RepID=A0ABQ0JC89_9VIBR|nr:general secretion pathway protein C [Vibrio variabilis]
MALNGADLTDPAAMGQIYQSITELTELNLTVERDGQQHDIFIQF